MCEAGGRTVDRPQTGSKRHRPILWQTIRSSYTRTTVVEMEAIRPKYPKNGACDSFLPWLLYDSVSAWAKHRALTSRSDSQQSLPNRARRCLQCTLVTSQCALIDQSELWRHTVNCRQRRARCDDCLGNTAAGVLTDSAYTARARHSKLSTVTQSTLSPNWTENISIFALFNCTKSQRISAILTSQYC